MQLQSVNELVLDGFNEAMKTLSITHLFKLNTVTAAAPLCGQRSDYEGYTFSTKEVTCDACIKKMKEHYDAKLNSFTTSITKSSKEMEQNKEWYDVYIKRRQELNQLLETKQGPTKELI